MGVADHYWGVLLTLSYCLILPVAGSSSDIVLTSTYQRGTKICKPVFNCHQGQQIKECASSMLHETCEECPAGLVQPDLISSVLKLESHRKCFQLQEARCSTRDTVPAREKDGKIFCAKYCKCDITKCFFGETSCGCDKKKDGCPPNYQLNGITGDCEPCPDLTYKHGDKCGPCEYNETAFNITMNNTTTVTETTPKPATPEPTTPKVKPTTTPKPTIPPTKGSQSEEKEGLSSVAVIIIAVLVVVLLILVGIMLVIFCCYCRGSRCKEFLKKPPFANGQPNGHLNGFLRNGPTPCDEKLYEEMTTIPIGISYENEPLVPPAPPPHPNHSPIRASDQLPPIPSQWSPTNNSYMSAVGSSQAGLRVTLPRQISHPVQDTTPHTPGSGGSSSLTNDFEAMNHYSTGSYLCPGPGISQEPIHAVDNRISDGINTDVKQQQSSPILCTEDNPDTPALPNFPTTNLSTDEFAHRNRGHFLPGGRALEHGENAAKENEEETQPKLGNQSANSSLQKPGSDHFVSLNQGTDKKHLIPNYTEVEKHKGAVNFSVEGKVTEGANYIGDAKVSPTYVDMEKNPSSSFVDKDTSQDEAYESVDPSNYNKTTKETKDSSIASNHSSTSGKS
ncbi:uncharacterized protein LOC110450495 [Mizuhopecten yessoensis]|uniref:Uncharacterized protein n=1 Tax=Mizuhopecten yessoensis TaxID=6573 RepID=A0A210R5A3_MIZYE|nr:uncharacterized protein LOC110450495 [Mizuhopecten yessoensis]OWF56199.1 hypothetical protein KP79_PYT21539 [Mizuhopecten yessoensis]